MMQRVSRRASDPLVGQLALLCLLQNKKAQLLSNDMASVKIIMMIENIQSHIKGGRKIFLYTHTKKWFFVQLLVDF